MKDNNKEIINTNIDNDNVNNNVEISDASDNMNSKTDNQLDNDLDYESGEVIEKKESLITKIKASFASKKFKGGAYATVISAIVLVMVLLVNIFATELDLKLDVSKQNLYTLSSKTEKYAKSVKDDITIYYLAQSGKEDETFKKIVDQYSKLAKNIKVEYKDPVLYPQFASQYVDNDITENSVLVVNNTNNRAKYVDNSNMYETTMDQQTYQTQVTAIDVEGQITSAIQYVTTDDLPIMYMVQGHGEGQISETLASSLSKVNVTTNKLVTLTKNKIPDDCSILLLNAPQSDYTKEEVKMIKDYLTAGGDAIILADYNAVGLDNFNSLLNYYGVGLAKGVVLEGDTNYYTGQYANNLVPTIDSHTITSSLKSDKTAVVVPNATGIQTLDTARSTIKIEPLLTTSDTSFSKVNLKSQNTEKEDGDISGPFNLGVAITETYNKNETKLVVFGSSQLIDDQMLAESSIGNLNLFVDSVKFITGTENSLAIPTKSVQSEMLSLTAAQANFWAATIVVILPLLLLIVGGFICIRRRKK